MDLAKEFFVYSENVVLPSGLCPATLHCKQGRIAAVHEGVRICDDGVPLHDFGTHVIMPGLVDSHVHINDPGRTWEGFFTATRAAAAGGITTVVDMPLNSDPVTTTLDALARKVDAAQGKLWVDAALLGGIVPEHIDEIPELIAHGVVGFKSFLCHSGIDEFPAVSRADVKRAMRVLHNVKRTTGKDVLYMFHAEDPEVCHVAREAVLTRSNSDPKLHDTFLQTRPKEAEDRAIEMVAELCEESGVRCHIVHLSSSGGIDIVKSAKANGIPLSAETTLHYLYFTAETVPDSGVFFKCCPPVREMENREELWQALQDGVITEVISDHSPCEPTLKLEESGDFLEAWGGIASLGLNLSIMCTTAYKERGIPIERISDWCCRSPAEKLRLTNKGTLEKGKDADFVVFDPDASFEVTADRLHFRHKRSPYIGETLYGEVVATFLRGVCIYKEGRFTGEEPTGQLITSTKLSEREVPLLSDLLSTSSSAIFKTRKAI